MTEPTAVPPLEPTAIGTGPSLGTLDTDDEEEDDEKHQHPASLLVVQHAPKNGPAPLGVSAASRQQQTFFSHSGAVLIRTSAQTEGTGLTRNAVPKKVLLRRPAQIPGQVNRGRIIGPCSSEEEACLGGGALSPGSGGPCLQGDAGEGADLGGSRPSGTSVETPAAAPLTLEQREQAYEEARRRIFGTSSGPSSSSSKGSDPPGTGFGKLAKDGNSGLTSSGLSTSLPGYGHGHFHQQRYNTYHTPHPRPAPRPRLFRAAPPPPPPPPFSPQLLGPTGLPSTTAAASVRHHAAHGCNSAPPPLQCPVYLSGAPGSHTGALANPFPPYHCGGPGPPRGGDCPGPAGLASLATSTPHPTQFAPQYYFLGASIPWNSCSASRSPHSSAAMSSSSMESRFGEVLTAPPFMLSSFHTDSPAPLTHHQHNTASMFSSSGYAELQHPSSSASLRDARPLLDVSASTGAGTPLRLPSVRDGRLHGGQTAVPNEALMHLPSQPAALRPVQQHQQPLPSAQQDAQATIVNSRGYGTAAPLNGHDAFSHPSAARCHAIHPATCASPVTTPSVAPLQLTFETPTELTEGTHEKSVSNNVPITPPQISVRAAHVQPSLPIPAQSSSSVVHSNVQPKVLCASDYDAEFPPLGLE